MPLFRATVGLLIALAVADPRALAHYFETPQIARVRADLAHAETVEAARYNAAHAEPVDMAIHDAASFLRDVARDR